MYIYICPSTKEERAWGPFSTFCHFYEIAFYFCVIIQGIQNIFGPSVPRILSGTCMLFGKTVTIWLVLAMDIPIFH